MTDVTTGERYTIYERTLQTHRASGFCEMPGAECPIEYMRNLAYLDFTKKPHPSVR